MCLCCSFIIVLTKCSNIWVIDVSTFTARDNVVDDNVVLFP